MVRRREEPVAEERELPLLPLFPHVLLPAGMLTVTMSGSNPLIKHLAHASGPDTLVAAVPYDPPPEREEEAAAGHELVLDHDRLFHTGTAARVAQLLKDNKSGVWTLTLEGLHRLGISSVTSAEPSGHGPWFVSASQLDHFASSSSSTVPSDGTEEAALAQRLVAQTRELTLRLQGRARGTEAARRIARVLLASGPERMTDTLGSLVARARTDRLLVLGTLDRLERMRLVSSQLERVLRALAKRAEQSASSSPDTSPNVSPGAITGLGAASKPQLSPNAKGDKVSLPEDDETEDVERAMARLAAARPPKAVLDVARREARRLSRTTEQSPGFAMGLAYLEVLADLPWDRWSWQQKETRSSFGSNGEEIKTEKRKDETVESSASSVTTGAPVPSVKNGVKPIINAEEEDSSGGGIISNVQDRSSTTESTIKTAKVHATQQNNPVDPSLASVRAALDAEHTGLEDVKRRIVEYVAVRRLRGWDTRAPVLCLVGPPGVGKTSLAASVARALSRPLQRMALGGVRDEAELRGHRRTYVGAMPGRVIKALQRAKVRDPLILLDEVDKMGRDGHRGDPAAALLEILDPEQNAVFTDTYLAVPFDLSPVLFIATANDAGDIPAPLLDRMELVQLGGYTLDEKLGIARKHLVPKLLAEHGLTDRDVVFADEPLRILVEGYTREAGVRNLSRSIAAICRHVVADVVKGLDDDRGDEKRLEACQGSGGDVQQEQQSHPGMDTPSNRHAMPATSGPSRTALMASPPSSTMVHATSMTGTTPPSPTGDLDGVMVMSEVPAAGGPDLASLAGCLARPSRNRTDRTRKAMSEYHGSSAGGLLSGWLSRRGRRSSHSIQETSPSSSFSHGQIVHAEPVTLVEEAHVRSGYPRGHHHRRKEAGVQVTAELIERVLKGKRYDKHDETHRVSAPGAAAGLVWTAAGGAVQYIECIATDTESKNGTLTLTGQLGDVLEESARIALSWARSHYPQLVAVQGELNTGATRRAEEFADHQSTPVLPSSATAGIPPSVSTWDVHVHLPAGAVPKDGPSAGITLAVALVSLFLNRAVRSDVAMTGELTLRGLVLPVGGVKEKLIAAHSAGVKRVFVPLRNLRDIEAEVPRVVKDEVEIVGVQRIEEVLAGAFDPPVVLRHAASAHL